MGAFGEDTPGVLRLCVAAVLFFLVMPGVYRVSAESKVDSDLVFENLDHTDVINHDNHRRISKDSDGVEIALESSPPVEEHWLSSTINRIKRSLDSMLSSRLTERQGKTKRKSHRLPRQDQGQEDVDEEYDDPDPDYNDGDGDDGGDDGGDADNEYDGNGEGDYDNENGDAGGDDYNTENGDDADDGEEEYDDNVEVEEEPPEEPPEEIAPAETTTSGQISGSTVTHETTTASEIPLIPTTEEQLFVGRPLPDLSKPESGRSDSDFRNETRYEDDDEEDDENLISSGASSGGAPTEFPDTQGPGHPVYYRISFTVSEPYEEDFSDRNSFKYQDFSEELVREIDNLYTPVQGTQSAAVIKIERREADAFTSKVTIDMGSDGFSNSEAIKDVLYRHITSQHRLGRFTVLPEDFQFRVFEALGGSSCGLNRIPCHSGECVDSEKRCNGVADCSDSSDEAGCGDIVSETSTTTSSTTTTTASSTTTTEATTTEFGSGEPPEDREIGLPSLCRADDVVRCDDNSRVICADQICDGIKDCVDGGDEKNCSTNECAEGEFSCDVSRCIPENKVCDGVSDCQDETDESTCFACESGIRCDNRCIPRSERCDGKNDCSDGSDESDCPPEAQCRKDEFDCGGGQCISLQQRCDRHSDCSNGYDEYNCNATAPCRDDQFTCQDRTCIPLSAKCNSNYDCGDLSDEKNCPCKPTDFRCGNGNCIPRSWRCNGIHNCQDRSDELDCPTSSRPGGHLIPQVCTSDDFRCRDGTCVRLSKRCDGKADCLHGEDEESCVFCNADHFQCTSGLCIDVKKRCDRVRDCPDNSDETGCNGKTLTCVPDTWMCVDRRRCIKTSSYCDGKQDCEDNSDERFCSSPSKIVIKGVPASSCADYEFQCAAGFCVMGYKRCNGIKDCPSGNDEDSCPTSPPEQPPCASSQFRCNDGRCISVRSRCDGVRDCGDYSDEINCYGVCSEEEVQCEDGSCIFGKRCDGIFDCIDGSDEKGCSVCTPGQFPCADGDCIEERLRCDGTRDCSDGSDEQNCVFTCPEDQFRCGNGVCLDGRRRCDGQPDCLDQSDELGCPGRGPQRTNCTSIQFDCGDACIDINYRCDKFPDCKNGADEQGCSQCSTEEFDCKGGRCIPNSRICDGHADCSDGSDEFDCVGVEPDTCTLNEYQCESGDCIPNYLLCNGAKECPDGSDERQCRTCGEPDWFQCSDGACVDFALRCDNIYDCRDFSDEQNCFACRNDQFQCSNGQCIPGNLRCDRRNDCSDGSDEFNCPTQPPPPVTELVPTPRPPPISCAPGLQPCRSGESCILRSQLCDGRVDCNDMSDETNCPLAHQGSCSDGEFRCENGPCIGQELRCDGKVDCPRDSSDELDCPLEIVGPNRPGPSDGLNLRTYPNAQEIKENREVVFQCRDEGPFRARVHWTRPNGQSLPPNSRDVNGRLEIPNIKVEHSGTYICEADGYPPDTPGAQVSVHLQVDRWIPPPTRPPTACELQEATCANGDCIPKNQVCDGKFDCTDGSDENRCNPNGCEPNEFRCANKKCVLKTWRCDSDDDCGDGSDEESCATSPPGSLCAYHQFTCHSNNQCIPRSYHCDLERDCMDGSDEIGCSLPVISKPPPPMVNLEVGSILEITCTAVGVPTPEIVWRLNWGHIPTKCRTTSSDGFGTLSCPDIQVEDQGAYSCEAINIKGTVFAVPDTILVVSTNAVCPAGYFNEEATSESECIKCFCFGQSNKCRSADLFIYQFQPPFDTLKLLGVRVDPVSGAVEIRDEPIYRNAEPHLSPLGRNGVHSQLPPYAEITSSNLVPYFAMPENYHGNQLKSYGGHLRFTVRHHNRGYPVPGPEVILTGNGYTLLNQQRQPPQFNRDENVQVRFFVGEWVKRAEGVPESPATREEIMMALANVENILIKLQYNEGPLNTTISNIVMDSAAVPNSGLGAASFVEECECPVGYSGTSCERCADGFVRHNTGPWLGQCYRARPVTCPAGTYGDPSRGRPCEVCPCPHTNPNNQFARTCSLGSDGEVTCDCPPGYVGRRCEQCAPGYSGNPLVPGDSCRPASYCSAEGSTSEEQGRCRCKDYVDGPTCGNCKPNTFYLSSENQFGCIACFCMGITRQCTSSNWFRDQISTEFTNSRDNFKLIDTDQRDTPIEQGINLDSARHEISYSSFTSPNVHYWSLPPRYLGDKITSYGGNLRYTLRYVPLPGGQSSRNSAADVELISANQISLLYYAREPIQPSGNPQTITVPLLEQYWQRIDGQKADREHLLMALADLNAIYIKATYNTNTRESALISVSLDTANEYNTGSSERALAVEQCLCPPGYTGLSCEDCAVGYTRAAEGIYLGLCEPCNCNGNSRECDSESGVCFNCGNFTTGENCDICLPGYQGDPLNGVPCRYVGGGSLTCNCDHRGAVSDVCSNGVCQCKPNVEGNNCDRCRPGTFGLSVANSYGCQACFCSGVTTECREGNFVYEQIPIFIVSDRHGFTLTDQNNPQRIEDGFQITPLRNEIGYTFRPTVSSERWYWSLPRRYTGNKIMSYGGRLEFTQRYTQRSQAAYVPDRDIILIGNGVTIFWSNPQPQPPNVLNKVSVVLNPSANWQRLDGNEGPRLASREDIMTVLANIDVILVRAQQSSETESAYLSDLTLDTAIEEKSLNPQAIEVEVCRCLQGYRGSSCESCAAGYYRDTNDYSTGPLGSCSRCPCNSHEQSCNLGPDNRVACNCLPGYVGSYCENVEVGTLGLEITPSNVSAQLGSIVMFTCKYKSMEQLSVTFRDNGVAVSWETSADGYTTWNFRVNDCYEHRIQCVIETLDGTVVGSVTALVNPDGNITTTPGTVISTTQPPPPPPPVRIEITIVASTIGIYKAGSTVRFNCTARSLAGHPVSRIYWSKDGASLPTHAIDDGRGLLVITNLRTSDSGRYICIAYDGYDVESKDIVATVGPSQPEPPRAVISPSFVDVQEGQSIRIYCAATGVPEPVLRLIRLDGQQLNPDHHFENGIFTISQARISDVGPYQCIATNEAGTHTANVEINVREREGGPIGVFISPQRYDGASGESFTLRCQADRSANLKWSRQYNVPLSYSYYENNGILTIQSPRPEDTGIYVCTAVSSGGYTASVTAEVLINESGDGAVAPTAKVTPERITISQGSSTELRCETTGSPTPTVKWTRMGSELPSHITQSGSVLYIRNALVADRGVYICVTSNSRGLAQASSIVEVNQLEIPILSIHPQATQTITSGNSAILACRVEAGIPSPTVSWERSDGRPLSANIERMSDNTLRFTQITQQESGEYICTAVNEAGRATVAANIIVHVAPEVWTVPNEEVILRQRNEHVRLECHASGFPSPTIQWRKLGTDRHAFSAPGLEGPESRPARNVAILEIARFSPQDQGLYICEARNDAGVAEKRIDLALDVPPRRGDGDNPSRSGEDSLGTGNEVRPDGGYRNNEQRPYLPPYPTLRPREHTPDHEETYTAAVGTRAELRCQINNNYDSDPIFVTWVRTNNSSLPSDAFIRSGTLYIDSVQPAAAGQYRCIGTHRGTGQVVFSVVANLEVISPPRITLHPPRQVVRPGDNAYIQCSATGQQPITIRWVPVGRTLPPSVTTRDGLIQFNNIQLHDAGRYRCTAVNSAGEADAVADVIVEENIHKPTLRAENRQQSAPIGSSITLRCRAHSSVAANQIRWFREHLPLPQRSRVNGEYLHIPDIQQQDQGRYYCELAFEGGTSNDYIDLQVTRPTSVTAPSTPTLRIQPPERSYRSGEQVVINCQSSEPGVITSWSKLSGWLASNVQESGGTLRIASVRPDNAGVYRCEATGHQGVYHKDYHLDVIDEEVNSDQAPLETKTAPQGSTVVLQCKTDLEQPVRYQWTKQGQEIPRGVDVYRSAIQLNDVSSNDAGIYTCTQDNGQRKIETATVLTVTGIVPHFAQAPNSYIALRTLPDSYSQFSLEVSFKPQNPDGLILYNGNKGSDKSGDFISLALVNAVPEFRFNLGNNVTIVRGDRALALQEWHTIKVVRYRKKATMFVDGEGPFTRSADGKLIGLDLSENLYLGGVPNFNEISPDVGVYTGFVGCISRFKTGYNHHDITKEALDKRGITTCETCTPDKCKNRGVCQEALSTEGYSCICTPGFSGANCEKLKGEACSPYTCGVGRCSDNDNGFNCLCPLGRLGRRCEREITINEPAFKDGAYVAYPTPKSQRRLKASLKIKPTNARDGILLYSAETDEGHGDFVSLAVRNGRIEFSFNVGGRPTVIRSENDVRPGEWHVITASRSLSEGKLIVDGETIFGSTPGNHKAINLLTPLFVGGYDSQNVKINSGVGVNSGFDGCISEISVSGLVLDIVKSAQDAANVGDCSAIDDLDNNVEENAPSTSQPFNPRATGCSNNPCRNGGVCYSLSPSDYKCSCPSGFSGRDCESDVNLCERAPCHNGGTCSGNATGYECGCTLGYSGTNCEQRTQLRNDAHFTGKSYLEFDRSLLDRVKENQDELIALELSTNSSNGLVFWHGQTPNEDGHGKNYISLGVVDGFLEFSYDLGSGPASIVNREVRVDDGHRHSVILKRRGTQGSIEVDYVHTTRGEAPGHQSSPYCAGNIYLGGAPNVALMTGRKFTRGLEGCVHAFELQNLKTLDLGERALSGANVKPCSSFESTYDDNDLLN